MAGKSITSLDMLKDLLCNYQQFEPRMMASLFLTRNGIPTQDLFFALEGGCESAPQPPSPRGLARNEQGPEAEAAFRFYATEVRDTPPMRMLYSLVPRHGTAGATNADMIRTYQEVLNELSGLARDALKPMTWVDTQSKGEMIDAMFDSLSARIRGTYVGVHYDPRWNAWVRSHGGVHLVLFSYGYFLGTALLAHLFARTLQKGTEEEEPKIFGLAGRIVGWIDGLLPDPPLSRLDDVLVADPECRASAKYLFDGCTLFLICHEFGHVVSPGASKPGQSGRDAELAADATATAYFARAQELFVARRMPDANRRDMAAVNFIKYSPYWLMGLFKQISPLDDDGNSTHPTGARRQESSDSVFRDLFRQRTSPVKVQWPWCEEFWGRVGAEVRRLHSGQD